MKPRKPRPFAAIRRRLADLDMPQYELAERMGWPATTLSGKMTGARPWSEPEMQKLVSEIGTPDQTLADYFIRRNV